MDVDGMTFGELLEHNDLNIMLKSVGFSVAIENAAKRK